MSLHYNRHVRRVKTVKIKADNESGFMIINESDFDEKQHKLYKAPANKKAKKDE